MKEQELIDIIACLPRGKTPFYYFKDRYALLLLSYLVKEGRKKGQIRNTPGSKLLDKKVVRTAIAGEGRDLISQEALLSYWPEAFECYLLTLGRWGNGHRVNQQTSRDGCNLVLQLNFSSRHNRVYSKLLDPYDLHPFVDEGHPVARGNYLTLAWARLDIDLETGEALIEELQNDWIRMSLREKAILDEQVRRGDVYLWARMNSKTINEYIDHALKPHIDLWAEAMLTAAIWFLKEEIGIDRIFYHTYRSGNMLKNIRWGGPPRSIYRSLPRKFCFEDTDEVPGFLQNRIAIEIRKHEKARRKRKED